MMLLGNSSSNPNLLGLNHALGHQSFSTAVISAVVREWISYSHKDVFHLLSSFCVPCTDR